MLSAMMKDKTIIYKQFFFFIVNNLSLEFSSFSSKKVIFFMRKGCNMVMIAPSNTIWDFANRAYTTLCNI